MSPNDFAGSGNWLEETDIRPRIVFKYGHDTCCLFAVIVDVHERWQPYVSIDIFWMSVTIGWVG